MTALLPLFHPGFDALSALADQTDLEAARTRVGRHVARCAQCRAVVEEIRAFGDAARGMDAPALPADLWSRIERRAAAAPAPRETPSPDDDAWRAAPALRPTRHVPSPLRRSGVRIGVGLALAAGLALVVLLPTSMGSVLEAAPVLGTWRFSPALPTPGSVVTLRFHPGAAFKAGDRLLLLARFAPTSDEAVDVREEMIGGLADSLTTLVRQADGTYLGAFTLPRTFTALSASLIPVEHPDTATSRNELWREWPYAILVGADARGRMSLANLRRALPFERYNAPPRNYSVPDTLIRYFPSHPAGFAYEHAAPSRRLLDDLIAYFTRGERQYLKFEQRLMAQPVVDADRELDMMAFAWRIEEPGEARKWVMRLVREHPEDPRALQAWAMLLHDMLQRNGTVDSVRAALPLADSLWERNGHRGGGLEMAGIANTVGMHDVEDRWRLRAVEAHPGVPFWSLYALGGSTLRDSSVRATARSVMETWAQRQCVRPAGRYPNGTYPSGYSVALWTADCMTNRGYAYAMLSLIARLDGDPARALALADSAIPLYSSTRQCGGGIAHRRRGEALLALGDTARAIRELAGSIDYLNHQAERYRDSLGTQLRGAIGRTEWNALVSANAERAMACVRAAERARRGAPGRGR